VLHCYVWQYCEAFLSVFQEESPRTNPSLCAWHFHADPFKQSQQAHAAAAHVVTVWFRKTLAYHAAVLSWTVKENWFFGGITTRGRAMIALSLVVFYFFQLLVPDWKSPSLCWTCHHGRRKAGAGEGLTPLNFEIWHFPVKFFSKNGCFLSFERAKWNFTTFSLGKIFWVLSEKYFGCSRKNPLLVLPRKISIRRPCAPSRRFSP